MTYEDRLLEQAAARIRLYRAAPAMLKALREIDCALRCSRPPLTEPRRIVRAAIMEATGENV